MMERLQAVKGMNDLLPPESAKWQFVETRARALLEAYGYREVRTPLVEPTTLFARAIGVATDIVEKEMYTFTDRDGSSLTLRPEGTAGAVRAYLEHQVAGREGHTRWYYSGPMYRHERAQKGRYRQFFQIGAEALNQPEPTVDAEMIAMLAQLFTALGIDDVDVLVNCVGGAEDRPKYMAALRAYLEAPGPDGAPRLSRLSETSQRRLDKNPLRILDSKDPTDIALTAEAPSILDHLGDASKAHFDAVLATLRELGVKFTVDARLVRGLDYYTGTVFEVRGRGPGLGAQNALCGGGRYDALVETLGGAGKTPAVGFAFGVERVVASIPGEPASFAQAPELCLVSHGDAARRFNLALAQELRGRGYRVDVDHRSASMKSQMKRADKLGARFVGVLGEDELQKGILMLRDMGAGEQRPVTRAEVEPALAAARISPTVKQEA
ncbi:MAG: histidine--tRNA ligase [Deltaproteobacteria bacterium]|nr:histidine--tRNA ligase [Deltaproteobacteria bacterium]